MVPVWQVAGSACDHSVRTQGRGSLLLLADRLLLRQRQLKCVYHLEAGVQQRLKIDIRTVKFDPIRWVHRFVSFVPFCYPLRQLDWQLCVLQAVRPGHDAADRVRLLGRVALRPARRFRRPGRAALRLQLGRQRRHRLHGVQRGQHPARAQQHLQPGQ